MQTYFVFPPFQLDLANEQLRCHAQTIALRPKTFAVLRYLVEHPGVLVTKDALLDAVWSGTVVSDAALKTCIRELRRALGDNDKAPRFIETVHGRGYRWLASLRLASPVPSSEFKVQSSGEGARGWGRGAGPSLHTPSLKPQVPSLVGREAELRQLYQWLGKALDGERQIVFVTGEPGIGKTTLIEAFLFGVRSREEFGVEEKEESQKAKSKRQKTKIKDSDPAPSPQPLAPSPWLGRGQCIEHYGAGEAYMPVLEALGRLCRDAEGELLIEVLSQYAPTWLVQLPALLKAEDFERLQRKVQGTTRERMLREMAEAVEAFTTERPLILCLEDLHWSDVSTLELLSVLARRHETARLLVLGTYRPVEMLEHGHPLRAVKQELQLHQQCKELRLGLLTEADVATYLQSKFPTEATDPSSFSRVARTIHQRTEGNPLFMVNVVDYLTTQGVLGESGEIRPAVQIEVPERIHQMIEKQLDRLSPEEQHVLEVASVAGVEFSAAAVAAGLTLTSSEVETCCSGLARREQFIRTSGISEWPDGTVATRYSFLHALYRDVLYERVPIGHRVALHHQIGTREEQAYNDQARAIAGELAVHFERGRDYRRAIKYLQQAGENALRRSAYQEAISLLTRGLELLKTLPDTLERLQQELTLQLLLGVPLMATKGYSAPEAEQIYTRARELCRHLGETAQIFPTLWGLWGVFATQGKHSEARELAEQCLAVALRVQDSALLLEAHFALGVSLYHLGELPTAHKHLEHASALYDLQQHHLLAFTYGGQDPGVICSVYAARVLWCLGYPDQALRKSGEALTLAQELAYPFSRAIALFAPACIHQFRLESQATQERAEALIGFAREQEFPHWLAWGTLVRSWALATGGRGEEAMKQLRESLAAFQALSVGTDWPYVLALRTETYEKVGMAEEGLAGLCEMWATVDKSSEQMWISELYRLKGELTLQLTRDPQGEADACFLKAIEIARKQQAKSLELRATMSLVRLRQQQAALPASRTTPHASGPSQHETRYRLDEAHQMLSAIYNWFTEGFDTKDLQDAKALIEELSR